MANPLIVAVGRADVLAALSDIDAAQGPDMANLIWAYIIALEVQIEHLREQLLSKSERLGLSFYGECDYAELYRRSASGVLTMGEDIAP